MFLILFRLILIFLMIISFFLFFINHLLVGFGFHVFDDLHQVHDNSDNLVVMGPDIIFKCFYDALEDVDAS